MTSKPIVLGTLSEADVLVKTSNEIKKKHDENIELWRFAYTSREKILLTCGSF